MAGYVNNSAPISERALQIARDSIPADYRGAYIFYRDSVPRTGMTESYTIAMSDRLIQTETGYSIVIDQGSGHKVEFIEFGFYAVPENAPSGTEGVCWWRYTGQSDSGFVQWPVQSQAGTFVYGSDLHLPRLKEIGGDPYVFAGLVAFLCVIAYRVIYHVWHHNIME